jgi:hypothetical protein
MASCNTPLEALWPLLLIIRNENVRNWHSRALSILMRCFRALPITQTFTRPLLFLDSSLSLKWLEKEIKLFHVVTVRAAFFSDHFDEEMKLTVSLCPSVSVSQSLWKTARTVDSVSIEFGVIDLHWSLFSHVGFCSVCVKFKAKMNF